MNINRNFIIIFGVSVLLVVTIFGLKAYYEEKELQESVSIPKDIVNYVEPIFNQNYPISLKEANLFQKACAIAVTSDMIKVEQGPREVFCIFGKNKKDNEDKYIVLRLFGKVMGSFYEGQYIGIAVNYRNLLQKNASAVSPDSSFNLCTITKPALIGPFREQLLLKDQINLNRNIVFSDGEVFCSKFFSLPPETLNLLISGFVPSTNLFQAGIYLIPEDKTVNDIFSQASFTNIEDILQSYPLLWNVEKPVI